MSFLKDIRTFKKDKLKATCTEVMREDGRRLVETRDEDGNIHVRVKEGYDLGFVGDYKPDLQVAEILPGLLLSSQDVAADVDLLQKHRVTHILNVASMVNCMFPSKFQYKRIEILDLPTTDIRQYFAECFPFIEQGREMGCVLVHCNAGRSRAASIVIGYLMSHERMSFQEAFAHVKSKRTVIDPNDGFRKQLEDYKAENAD